MNKAFRMIKESEGSHFGPHVAEPFLGIEGEILSIREERKGESDIAISIPSEGQWKQTAIFSRLGKLSLWRNLELDRR